MEDQPRQQRQAAATQELRDLSSSTRGPSTTQVLRVLMLVLLSGVLLLLAGLSLAGTLIGLAVTAPLFVLFSPVLIASALTIGLVVTGFLMSAAFVLMALFFFMRMNSLWTRMGEQCTISGGERRDSGPSASVDNGNGKSVVAVDQQQLVIGNNYYVFLSFRGPDTRKGFADHLYHKLKDVGLRFHPNFVFRDNEDLPFGEDLGANLISAIMHSKVSIPIISKNYANSEWCLRELIGIMECKESRGQIVLPVLYKVETKDVRYLKGSVKHAFESRKYWSDEAVKQRGKEALSKAAECRVYESENFADGHEAELVDELVATVMRKQQEDFQPYLHENLVGNDDDVVEVMRLVDTACPNTRIIGIYGISGIGKTTLATIVYEKLFDKFDCRSFLRDVGEKLKSNGIEHVQSQLISDILNKPKYKVLDSNEGIKMIQTNCAEKKVLILLDDVNHQDHLNKLIGNGKFMRGSRIIITCRDEATLKSEYHKYKCRELNFNNSLRLFNIHAFEGKPPPMELASLSSEIVATTGGLPLALIVIGSLLKRTKDPKAWEEYRDKWTKEPQREVIDRLKISYDALEEGTKQMFQDITCFFIGTDHRIATYLWSDLQLYPRSGLQKMMELSLIKYDDNKLRMHDQLRDLGRCMARPANKKHWDYKRLWDEEAMKVLGREEENENIEALCLDERGSRELVERECFKKMPNLKFLHVNDVDFDGDFGGSFSELRWLKWEGCRDSFEATNLHLQKLVILDLSDNGISGNWRGWSSIKMERLKVLNLSWCLELKSTPNLSAFKNLEMLILEHCAHLEEINTSIGDVKRLISLNLSSCRSLEKLPKQLGELENLEELVIDRTWIKEIPPCIGSLKKLKRLSAMYCLLPAEVPSPVSSLLAECYKLQQIPSSIGKLGELVELDLSNTWIKELPESIGELKKLKILRIFCSQIEELPSSIGKLQSLQEFDADGCFYLKAEIHVDKGGLSSLKTLCLGRAKISCLPENLDQLSSLEHLNLLGCRDLQSLPKLPFSLSCLRLTHESNELPSLSHLKHLKELVLWLCKSLQSIPELPSCIRKLCVERCPKLERLPKLSDLEFLSELGLVGCNGLKKLDGLEALKSLGELNPSRESELFNLDDFVAKVDKLHAIPGLEKLGSLEVVDISGCKHIEVLDLSKSKDLKELIVRNCESLVEIHCPSNFLEHFDRHGCKSLKKLPAFLPPDRARFNYRTFTTCPHGRKVELIKEEVRVIADE